MKRLFWGIGGLAVIAIFSVTACAQRNPRDNAKVSVNGKDVSVEYGRPALKGRKVEDMLGKLPAGEVWRLGADTSTTFTTTGDLKFGDVSVAKGAYSLWARKESDGSWKLVFNTQHGQWGTEHEASKDAYAVPLKEEKGEKSAEQVTITLEKESGGGEISIAWGNLELSTNFK